MQSWLRVRQNGTGGADDGRLDYIAAVVLDSDMTMRFGAVRLLAFELLLPPTRFSTRFVSASELIAFVDLVCHLQPFRAAKDWSSTYYPDSPTKEVGRGASE